jgi:hypothetical protein
MVKILDPDPQYRSEIPTYLEIFTQRTVLSDSASKFFSKNESENCTMVMVCVCTAVTSRVYGPSLLIFKFISGQVFNVRGASSGGNLA